MATLLVVYRDGQNHISGGARSYRKWGHRKSRDRKRSWLEVTASGLDPEVTKWSRAHARKWIPTLFSYYSSTKCSTVVQIPGLPEVTKGQVTPKEVPLVWFHACGTGSSQYSPYWGLFTGNDVIKRHVTPKEFPWKGGLQACATGSCAVSDQMSPVEFPWKIWERACAIESTLGVISRTSTCYNLLWTSPFTGNMPLFPPYY